MFSGHAHLSRRSILESSKMGCRFSRDSCMQALQEDLAKIMHLEIQHKTPEYQLGYYPQNGSQYVCHR